ncbi:MAG: DUF1735 domain-containing protein [Pedobacter sp.]|nr:MAG: DUF1735 domain-containing protein [Pedobacter sp.]
MNRIFKYAVAGSLVLGLASCLKDEGFDNGTTGHDLSSVPKIIEIGFKNESAKTKTFAFNFEDLAVERTIFYVRLAAGTVAQEDITVTLDTTGTAAALAAINANYEPLPASFFTTTPTGFTVTIPKGQSQVGFQLKTNAIQFDPSTTYGLVYKIKSISSPNYNISGNYGAYTVLFGAKNKYDGVYRGKGYGFLGGNTMAPHLFNWDCNFDINLITISGNEVVMDAQPLYRAPGTTTYGFSNVIPGFRFDNATNKVIGVFPAGASVAMNFPVDGGTYDSRYDPATKTIFVSFGVNNSATWRIIDTLTYCGPRG